MTTGVQLQSSTITYSEPAIENALVAASGVGVQYVIGNRREDFKSLTHNAFQLRRRQKFWALRDISFSAYAGDVLGIVGSNGAGKTTLCRVLSGLLRPDRGTVVTRGSVSALLSLGTGFNSQLSGRENIFLNGMMLGLSKRYLTELLPHIVAFAGLGRFIDEPLKSYSTGMRARLGFSIAAMLEPEILILDEALSAGDLAFSEKAGNKIRELTQKAKLVIVVTHQLSFIETYCTRALWLDNRTVQANGSAREVASLYKDAHQVSASRKKIVNLSITTSKPSSTSVVVVRDLGVQFTLQSVPSVQGKKNSRHWYRKNTRFKALQDVSFDVYEGDILGIIGPNGAGKTTLCRILSGMLRPDTGEIKVEGDITALLTIGVGFNAQLSGRDNIFLNGMMLGIPKKKLDALYESIVEFSGLAQFIYEPVKHYSQGMRARLGFSIMAMIEPDVLIIDEALSVGDATFSERASAKIQELISSAKAVIVVTHNMAFVEKVCTKSVWLDAGRVQFVGNPAETVQRYRQSLRG